MRWEPCSSIRTCALPKRLPRYATRDQPLISLVGADLSNAKLYDFPLDKTCLKSLDLEGADLSGATLDDANLSDATVTEQQLNTTLSLKGTIMPDGSEQD
jgi:uncharacterized protein YjbI with pentapeptide repeats